MKALPAIGIVLSICSGCAFGSRNVNLVYEPTRIPSAASHGHVAVCRFKDVRTPDAGVGKEIGKVRNMWGMTTAHVNANQDPVIWVADSLARGLSAQGFTVERVDSPSAAGDLPVVTGSVTKVFADLAMVITGEVQADVSVERQGQQVTKLACVGKDSKVAWTGSANEYQDRINAAMRQFVDTCAPQIVPYVDSTR